MHTANLAEVEEKLKVVKAAKFEEPKVLVLISSVFTWGHTPKKLEAVAPAAPPDPPAVDTTDPPEEPAEAVPEEPPEMKELPFEETDYQAREPLPEYLLWRDLENLVLSLNNKENLSCYVLCAGVLYGNGEMSLEDLFKHAWLELPPALPYVGEGTNKIPTIHIRDSNRLFVPLRFWTTFSPQTRQPV